MDLQALRRQIESEIDHYVYEVPSGAIGTPWPQEKVEAQLAEFRAALVAPKWEQVAVRDTQEQMRAEGPLLRWCIVVAVDGKGYRLYFDPEENNYALACEGAPPETIGVRGDAVGCFMAR